MSNANAPDLLASSPSPDGLVDVEMEEQQNIISQPSMAAATTNSAATKNDDVGAASFEEGAVKVNDATMAQAPRSEYSTAEIERATKLKFKKGDQYENESDLYEELFTFANHYNFTVANRGKGECRCGKAANSWSKKKKNRDHVLQIKDSSQVTECQWQVRFHKSQKDNIFRITTVVGTHNHPCDIPTAVVSRKKGGKAVSAAITRLTNILGPFLAKNTKMPCNLIRRTIEPYVSPGVTLSDVNIRSILTGVKRQMDSGKYKPPEPVIGIDDLRAFTSVDITSTSCRQVLDDLLSNASTNGDNSWIVTRLMNRLKANDPYFDFRIHTDENDHVDCVTWQVGASRAALMKYGDKVFLDTRNNENMNCINMQYMSFVVIDGNKRMLPASESFVFSESDELYDVVVNYTLEMTPRFSRDSVVLGFGDMFISAESAKRWFPNITWLVDTYHFCSSKKKDNVLVKSFGPRVWQIVATDMRAAVYAKTEEECLVSNTNDTNLHLLLPL